MNNVPPNKWIVFIQWAVGLQWLRLVYDTFTSPSFSQSSATGADPVATVASLPGYDTILPPDIINISAILIDVFLYGSISIAAVLLIGGAWMLLHKPVRVRPVTLMILVLILGAVLNLLVFTAFGDIAAPIRNTAFLMGVLHAVLALYYLAFRRYKKHNHGTNLQYTAIRGVS